MKKIAILFLSFVVCAGARGDGSRDRAYWVETLVKIADPVLRNMSEGCLRATMPVETVSGAENPSNAKTTHLEALGRTLAGIAPWLELGPDDTPEGKLRAEYIRLACASIRHGVDRSSPDSLNFTVTRQPLVDAAFLCHGLLRAPKQLWGNLDPETKRNFIAAMNDIRKITPPENNWLLFSAMVEAAMLELTGEWNVAAVGYALDRFQEWYAGDGWYGDGAELHFDYYNSFVIHPMLYDVLLVMHRHGKGGSEFLAAEHRRFMRYAAQQEMMISPEGYYPVVGRSIAYRFGVFQALSMAALRDELGDLSPAAVRCALTAVVRRQMAVDGNFDPDGWLTLGFCGHQPAIAERYISTGSLYLAATAFLALGLPPQDPFWSLPDAAWSGKRAWNGEPDIKTDKALKD